MHKRLTLGIGDERGSQGISGGRTTETEFPLSSHPSQDVSSSGRGEESMLVLTANNVSMASKRRRQKQPKSGRESFAYKSRYMHKSDSMMFQNRIIGLKRNSPVLKEAFYSLIKLSTKLIDINWDKTILATCLQVTDA